MKKLSDFLAIVIIALGLITIALAIFIVGFELTLDFLK